MPEPILISSNMELATLFFGWHMYGQLWALLQATGLAFLPFLGMIIRNFVLPITATYTTSAAQLSLKKMEWDLIQMLVIIVLAGQPLLPINVEKYNELQLCLPKNEETAADPYPFQNVARPAQSPMAGTTDALVPLWWYAVMSVSTGFTEAAKVAVPCAQDARQMLSNIMSRTVVNAVSLEAEIVDFIDKCYTPTKSFIELDKQSGSQNSLKFDRTEYNRLKSVAASTGLGDPADINYVGSAVFNEMGKSCPACSPFATFGHGNFYDSAGKQIVGWDVNQPTKAIDVSCRDWWGGPSPEEVAGKAYDIGIFIEKVRNQNIQGVSFPNLEKLVLNGPEFLKSLRYRIFLSITKDPYFYIDTEDSSTALSRTFGDLSLANVLRKLSQQIVLKGRLVSGRPQTSVISTRMIHNIPGTGPYVRSEAEIATVGPYVNAVEREKRIDTLISRYIEANITRNAGQTPASEGSGGFKNRIATVGMLIASLGTYVTAYIAKTSFPYIQAMLLMGIYMFLSIGLVFSGYTLEFLLAGSLGIFTMKFMAFVIYFCTWLDNNLILLLSGSPALSAGNLWEAMNAFASDAGFGRLILDYTVAGLYFTLPALFGTVMVWAGVRGAEVIGEMQKAQQPLTQAAEKGAQHVQSIATQAGGMVLGVATSKILGK